MSGRLSPDAIESIARAEADYQRFRGAYLDVAKNQPDNDLALGMIGADMQRAHLLLQALTGTPGLAFTPEPIVISREAGRLAEENH